MKKEDLTDLLQKLISIESPYFQEEEIMGFTCSWLNEHGVEAQIHSYHEKKETNFHGKNVVGVMDSGKAGPTVYLGGHLDTVSLCTGWSKAPYEGVVEDGFMYGVGALDMKAGCAALMLAVAEFAEKQKEAGGFRGKLIYHFVSDEEGPYGLGTVFIINDKIHNIKETADFAIIAEPSAGFTRRAHPCICLGARGGYNYTIKIKGKSAHAATPELGISALDAAAEIISEINKIEPVSDEQLGNSSICVIDLRSRGGACSVPDYAEVEVFHHTVRGETQQTIRRDVEAAIENANVKCKTEIVFRQSPADGFDGGFIPYCIDENNEYLHRLEESIERVCGRSGEKTYFQSIGDFNHIGGLLEIPTVLLGPDGENFHSADEKVNISSTLDISKIVLNFLENTLL